MPIQEMYGSSVSASNGGTATVDVNIPLASGKPAPFVVAQVAIRYFKEDDHTGYVGIYSYDQLQGGVVKKTTIGSWGSGFVGITNCTRVTFVAGSFDDVAVWGVGSVFVWR
jgi:hypothetical protein